MVGFVQQHISVFNHLFYLRRGHCEADCIQKSLSRRRRAVTAKGSYSASLLSASVPCRLTARTLLARSWINVPTPATAAASLLISLPFAPAASSTTTDTLQPRTGLLHARASLLVPAGGPLGPVLAASRLSLGVMTAHSPLASLRVQGDLWHLWRVQGLSSLVATDCDYWMLSSSRKRFLQ